MGQKEVTFQNLEGIISWEVNWEYQISGLSELRTTYRTKSFLNSFRQTHPWENKKNINQFYHVFLRIRKETVLFFCSKDGFLGLHSTNYIMGQGTIHIATVHHYWVQQIVPGHVVGVRQPARWERDVKGEIFQRIQMLFYFLLSTLNTHPKCH